MSEGGALHWVRQLLGCIAWDLPHYVRGLWAPRAGYAALRNRHERLEAGPGGIGFRCDWQWTSTLHAPAVLPGLGRRIMRLALHDHPFVLRDAPACGDAPPAVSFIIGHRGAERVPHLLATLRSIAGQHGANVECIVVEQDVQSQLPGLVPSWVRVVHTPPPHPGMPYARAWAFNVGARHARAPWLVLHDNDMLVPADYASFIAARAAQGYEAVNAKRFIFYLDERATESVFRGELTPRRPEAIVQNLQAGGSMAIARDAYERIGGMDEGFVGWGGEDNEFWERAETLRLWSWGALPIVHLWHAAQPRKYDPASPTALRYRDLARIAPRERIAALRTVASGSDAGPVGWAAAVAEERS